MKSILLLSSLLFLSLNQGNAQMCGILQSDEVVPSSPLAGQEQWLNLQVYCNVGYYLTSSDINQVGNTFYLNVYYCEGMTQATTLTNDSISLGMLSAGSYSYFVNIYSSNDGCQTYGQTDQGSGTWIVDNALFVPSIEKIKHTHLFPNPASQSVTIQTDLEQVARFELVDVQGKVWMSGNLKDKDFTLNLPAHLASGSYFLQLFSTRSELLNSSPLVIE